MDLWNEFEDSVSMEKRLGAAQPNGWFGMAESNQ